MKKIFILVAVALTVVHCAKDFELDIAPEGRNITCGGDFLITASYDDVSGSRSASMTDGDWIVGGWDMPEPQYGEGETRTSLDSNGLTTLWSEGDQIGVVEFDADGKAVAQYKFTLLSGAGTKSATFSGADLTAGKTYRAYYPYRDTDTYGTTATIAGDAVNFSISTRQTERSAQDVTNLSKVDFLYTEPQVSTGGTAPADFRFMHAFALLELRVSLLNAGDNHTYEAMAVYLEDGSADPAFKTKITMGASGAPSFSNGKAAVDFLEDAAAFYKYYRFDDQSATYIRRMALSPGLTAKRPMNIVVRMKIDGRNHTLSFVKHIPEGGFEAGKRYTATLEADVAIWDAESATLPAIDMVNKVITVRTASELAWVSAQCNGMLTEEQRNGFPSYESPLPSYTVILANDINLQNRIWWPIGDGVTRTGSGGSFAGALNGNGKTITGLRVIHDGDYQGLIGVCSGKVYDLTILDGVVDTGSITFSHKEAGSVAGLNAYGLMENCHNINCRVTGKTVGGISGTGWGYGNASGCYGCTNSAPVTSLSGSYAGGIIGTGGNVMVCHNKGRVSGNGASAYVGGIAGRNGYEGGPIISCINSGEVSASASAYCGSLTGSCGSEAVDYCFYTGGTAAGVAGTGLKANNWTFASTPVDMADRLNEGVWGYGPPYDSRGWNWGPATGSSGGYPVPVK